MARAGPTMADPLDSRLQERIADQLRLAQLARSLSPYAAVPYFAHMRLETEARVRDFLLGPDTRTGSGVAIIDWRNAPLAEVFFSCAEGDDYEIDAGERTLTGTLLERNLVSFAQGELCEIETGAGRVELKDGTWHLKTGPEPELTLRPEAERLQSSSPADVILDAAQRRIVELPAGRAVLLLGEAGFGKTTVALHRLARLRERVGPDLRAAVIVPTEGLRRLSAALLERMGVNGVEVCLYDRWAGVEARRAFHKLPERESQDASAGVIRIKRDPALRGVLAELAARQPGRQRDGRRTRRRDLLHVFGDRVLMQKLAAASEQGESDLYFSPDSIPALGWNTFYVKAGAACALPGPAVTESADKIVIENDLIKVAIDKKTGLLISLFDKRLGKEMLKAPSNKVVAYTDRPTEYPAWNLAENYLAKPIPVPAATSVKVDAQGPVFVRVLVERKGRPTSFKQWITVYSDSPLVNLITWSDMHWKNSITKIEFNTAVETDKVAAEIPYAVISRSTHPKVPWDKARTEMPVEKWADLSEKDFGVALLNFGKYAFSLTEDGQGFRMSIVKNAKYPTAASEAYDVSLMEKIIPYQETDAGEHWAHLALLPHPGDWKTAKVYKSAYEYNTPAVVYPTNAHDGLLPKEASLLSLESASAYIAQVKKAEDDGDLVVRMVEAEGKDGSATLKVNPAFKIMSAVETNLLELEPKPLKFDGQSVTVPLGHFEIKTLKIGLASK